MEKIQNFYSEDKAETEAENITLKLNQNYPEQQGNFTKEQYDAVEREFAEEQVELIKSLSSLNVPVYLFGGYATELLLLEKDGSFDGKFLEPHTDIDMAVDVKSTEVLRHELEKNGFVVKDQKQKGQITPIKIYLSNSKGVQGDFALLEEDETSGQMFMIGKSGDKLCKVYFCEDVLKGKSINLDGVEIRVWSPRGLIQSLLFYTQMGISDLREKDKIRAERLIQKYFPEETIDSDLFKVRIEEIAS